MIFLHCIAGVKAYLHDRNNPAWTPTLYLGQQATSSPAPDVASERYKRVSQRKDKKKVSDAVSSLLSLKKRRIDFSDTVEEESTDSCDNLDCDTNSSLDCTTDADCAEQMNCKEIQTDLTAEAIQQLESDNTSRLLEAKERETSEKGLYDFQTYENDPDKVAFYTGLPNLEVLKLVFNLIEGHMISSNKCLSKETEYLLCLVKLRMNYLFKDMAYHLNVSVATVQRSFHNTLDVLYARLHFLVQWPKRENLRKSMPQCFRKDFGQKVVVILDCFELFTERPSGALNKVYTYSNYKHHQTVKYLIGIAPHGVVTFISEGWGGRTSDKFITEKTGLLENLLPGDVVMVDRGFKIEEGVNFYQAELAIPNFTRGKTQLHPLEVEKTRRIASVRIHVERVIGLLLRKFRIFEGIVPLEFIKLRSGENIPTIDKIVKVCCCLTNLCTSVVPFE